MSQNTPRSALHGLRRPGLDAPWLAQHVISIERMVPLSGESLNTVFSELADWEDQLKPYAKELEELGL